MNIHVTEFYKNRDDQEVIPMHEHPPEVFEEWLRKAPTLPRGWWELARLNRPDRLEFTAAFWNMRFPYSPYIQKVIQRFFTNVEDLGIYLVKKKHDPYFSPHLVYSMNDETRFYRGFPPATKEEIKSVHDLLQHRLPEEYISLIKIHNGFTKNDDQGILPLEKIGKEMHRMHAELVNGAYKMVFEGEPVDPAYLVPFYKGKEDGLYQCFHKEWYPDRSMGTLGVRLFSGEKSGICPHLIFPSFLNWLIAYMDTVDV